MRGLKPLGVGLPLAGLGAAFAALLLWVSAVALPSLDALCLGMFALGLGASVAGYFVGRDVPTRRLGVVGIGCNGLGVIMLAVLYAAG